MNDVISEELAEKGTAKKMIVEIFWENVI